MTIQKEESNLWLFESHNNSKRSQWLQSTLSELEEKTKGMLKLIEGEADTFSQRAEMYYKKRPELINMIEDFYRSYRSLAERHDQLKFESGNSFSNRGLLQKEWSFIDKSSNSSSVTFDSESEVDDPPEEEQVESKNRERSDIFTYSSDSELNFEQRYENKEEICVVMPMIEKVESKLKEVMRNKRERCEFIKYSSDSELSNESYPEEKEARLEFKLEEFSEKSKEIRVVEKVEPMYRKSKAAHSFDSGLSDEVHPEEKETQVELKLEKISDKKSRRFGVKPMVENFETNFIEIQGNHPLAARVEKLYEPLVKDGNSLHPNDKAQLSSEVERLKEQNLGCKVKVENKDEEKREVKSEKFAVNPMIENFETNFMEIRANHPLAERVEKPSEPLVKDPNFPHPNDKARLSNEVKRLTEENSGFKVELEKKDEEKREVIRQLSMSVDILKGENDSLKKFIRDSKNRNPRFELRKLKGLFLKKIFGSQSTFPTTLVAL